jgi:hypothetical protein
MLTGQARAGEKMEKNEIAHFQMFELRHLFGTYSWRLNKFSFHDYRITGLS